MTKSIVRQEIYESIGNGIIQKPIQKALEEANRLMDEENMNCFEASSHITYFCDITKEEALRLLLNYRNSQLYPKSNFKLKERCFESGAKHENQNGRKNE